jgi:hypothetical protein
MDCIFFHASLDTMGMVATYVMGGGMFVILESTFETPVSFVLDMKDRAQMV